MNHRTTPAPASLRPDTGKVDESWDDLVIGALGESTPDPDDDIFDRATAVPVSPLHDTVGLELELNSSPPRPARTLDDGPSFALDSSPPESGREALLPGGRGPALAASRGAGGRVDTQVPLPGQGRSDRKRTVPEPVVERSISRVETGVADPADSLAKRRGRAIQNDETDAHSPLDLVENFRRASQTLLAAVTDEPHEEVTTANREGGTLRDMQDRYAVGDFTGALVVAESILDANPEHEDAKRYAQSCREVLTQMYAARIGPMDQIAVVAVPPDQITWLSLDHRAGFLLSLIDGVSSIEEILDISGMTRLDALRIMYTLVQQNVLTLSH